MKTIITCSLTPAFYTEATNYARDNNVDLSIHEYFRDHFVYATFKTVHIEQNGVTGVYTLTVEPSCKDFAPLSTLVGLFCRKASASNVKIDGYKRNVIDLVLWLDEDELTYHANINNGPVPDCACNSFDELQQWVDGFKQAAEAFGAIVQLVDTTEEV